MSYKENAIKMFAELFEKIDYYEKEKIELEEKYGVNDHFKEMCAMGSRWLREKGLSPAGDAGDVSIRDPRTGLIYITGGPAQRKVDSNLHSLSDIRFWEISVMDIDGNLLVPWSYPTVEMPMHLEIMRARPDVNCIVHTHGPWSTIFSMAGMDIPFLLAEQVGSIGPDPIACNKEYGAVNTFELGEQMVKALGRNNAALMRNHGAVAVGRDLYDGFKKAEYLEDVAKKTIYTLKMGQTADLDVNDVFAKTWNKTFHD